MHAKYLIPAFYVDIILSSVSEMQNMSRDDNWSDTKQKKKCYEHDKKK